MFFEPNSFKERVLGMPYFTEWAGEIANSYFNAGAEPTETLCKIAQSEDLTPHQVAILAAEANKEIFKHKYASVKDKYHAADFPLADAKIAIKSLQADGGEVKLSSHMPEPVTSKPELDLHKAFGVKPEVMDKTASVKTRLKHAEVHGDFLKQAAADKALMAKYAADAAENVFIKEARQIIILGDSSSERMKALGTIDHFVKCAGIPEGREPLAKLAYALGKEGLLTPSHAKIAFEYLTKEADQVAPEELISKWLPAQIVNGEHPLYITLKTFKDRRNALDERQGDFKLIQDQLGVVKQKVRAL